MRSVANSTMNSTTLDSGFNSAYRRADYEYWTVEELRAFGTQLQLPNARLKSRLELLEILDVKALRRVRSAF